MIRIRQATEGKLCHGWMTWINWFKQTRYSTHEIVPIEKKVTHIAQRLSDEISRQVIQPIR